MVEEVKKEEEGAFEPKKEEAVEQKKEEVKDGEDAVKAAGGSE